MRMCECNDKSCSKSDNHGMRSAECGDFAMKTATTPDGKMGWLTCVHCQYTYLGKGWQVEDIRFPLWDSENGRWIYQQEELGAKLWPPPNANNHSPPLEKKE